MLKIPITPASGVSPIAARRWTNNLLRAGCIDYFSVRYKSNCCKEMIQTTLCKSAYADYSSVRCKASCFKRLGDFDHVPIIPASGGSSILVRRYGIRLFFAQRECVRAPCSLLVRPRAGAPVGSLRVSAGPRPEAGESRRTESGRKA
jgi:hypothetical protein